MEINNATSYLFIIVVENKKETAPILTQPRYDIEGIYILFLTVSNISSTAIERPLISLPPAVAKCGCPPPPPLICRAT